MPFRICNECGNPVTVTPDALSECSSNKSRSGSIRCRAYCKNNFATFVSRDERETLLIKNTVTLQDAMVLDREPLLVDLYKAIATRERIKSLATSGDIADTLASDLESLVQVANHVIQSKCTYIIKSLPPQE